MDTANKASALAIKHKVRVAILDALVSGVRVEPAAFAKSRGYPPKSVAYHFKVLVDVGAITVDDAGAKITERGEVLQTLAQQPERRIRQRRKHPRRRD